MQPTSKQETGRVVPKRAWYERSKVSMFLAVVGSMLFILNSFNGMSWNASASSVPPDTVIIGTGTTYSQREPLNIYYNYHCDGALYLASEIGRNGTITDISWQRATANQDTIKNVTIYMREVADSDLSSSRYDSCAKLQEASGAGTLVWSGNLTVAGSPTGWIPDVHLATPFAYSGKYNLLVSVRHQSGWYWESSTSYYYYTLASYLWRTGSSASQNPPTIGSVSYDRPNIRMKLIPNLPPQAPTLKTPIDCAKLGNGTNSVTPTFTWYNPVDLNGDSLHYQIQVSTNPDFTSTVISKDSSVNSTGFSTVPATSGSGTSSYTIQSSDALTNMMTYYWRVRAIDLDGSGVWSAWSGLLYENFDAKTSVPFGWTVKDGTWSIDSSKLQGVSGKIMYTDGYGKPSLGWTNYTLNVKERDISQGSAQDDIGKIYFRLSNFDSATYLVYQQKDGTIVLQKKNSIGTTQNTTSFTYSAEKQYKIEVKGQGSGNVKIRITYNGNVVTPGAQYNGDGWWTEDSYYAKTTINSGAIGFEAKDSTAQFDNVTVTPDVRAFTIDESFFRTAWHQTAAKQFTERDVLSSTNARADGYNDVVLTTTSQAIGTGAGTQHAPLNVYATNYHWAGMLYTKDDIGTSGVINKLYFYRAPTLDVDNIRNISIYIKETTDTDLSASKYNSWSEFESGATLVYTSTLVTTDGTTQGWYPTFTLNPTFSYDGTKSLLVGVKVLEGSYELTGSFYRYTSSTNKFRYGDAWSNYPPSLTLSNSRPNIKLDIVAPTGTLTSPPIRYTDNSEGTTSYGWSQAFWNKTSGGGTSGITVTVQWWNQTSCAWTDALTSSVSPINLTSLNTTTHPILRLVAGLSIGTGLNSPVLLDWTVTWKFEDSDGDGLPDWWEILYGLNPFDPTGNNGANGDPDKDGFSNMDEYLNDMDPHSSTAVNAIIVLNHDYTLPSGGSATLENCSFMLNGTGQRTLTIPKGTEFKCNLSYIAPYESTSPIKFTDYGKLTMIETSVSNLWSDQSTGIGGLMLYSNFVNLTQVSVMNSYTGAYLKYANISIKDSKISNTTYGIIVDTSSPSIKNTSVESNLTGINIIGSGSQTPQLDRNNIYALNGEGIKLTNSKGYIANNTIKSEANTGLVLQDCTQATVNQNIVTGNQIGLMLNDSTTTSVQSSVINGTDFGMKLIGGSATISDTETHSIANASLYLSDTNPTISGSTFATATNASLKCVNSSPTVTGCTLLSYDYTLWVGDSSHPILHNMDYDRSKVYVQDTTDNDSDGISNGYEIYKYGLNPNVSDANADTDGDTYTNVEEVNIMDTDPTNASDPVTGNNVYESWGQMNNSVQNISISGNATQPVMVVDNNNTLHMAYLYTDASNATHIMYQKSFNGGANWTEAVQVTNVTNEPKHLSLAYDNNTDTLSIAWEENNPYDASMPASFVKYMTGKPTNDGTNPFLFPVFLCHYNTSAFENATSRTNLNVTNNEIKLDYTQDSPTQTVSTTNIATIISANNETYGQTFTATKSFDRVGLYAASELQGTLYVALYGNPAKTSLIGYQPIVNVSGSPEWYDFAVPLQLPGTYYLEWSTDNATKELITYALDPGTYSGGCAYRNNTTQSYDFRMRWYTVTYASTGTLISNGHSISTAIDKATVSWDAILPSETTVTVQVSNNNGGSYVAASNHQIISFASSGSTLKYTISLTSDGASTPVFRWLQIDQSVLDYGINPSIGGWNGSIYIIYQPISLNHSLWKNVTFSKSSDNGTTWNNQVFAASSSENEDSIQKLTVDGDKIYVSYFKLSWFNNTQGALYTRQSSDDGNSWTDAQLMDLNAIEGITGPESLSIAARENNFYTAYSAYDDNTGGNEIFTQWGYNNGGGTGLLLGGTYQHTTDAAASPQLAVDTLNNLYVGWSQTDSSAYIKIVNRSGETTLMPNTAITTGKTSLGMPVIATDLAGEVHAAWKENVNGNSSILYWNNLPKTPTTMAGTINNYLGMLPSSYYTNHSTERKIGLQSRAMKIANYILSNDWQKTMQESDFRLADKLIFTENRWINHSESNAVLEQQYYHLYGNGYELNPYKGTEFGGSIITSEWKELTRSNCLSGDVALDTNGNGRFTSGGPVDKTITTPVGPQREGDPHPRTTTVTIHPTSSTTWYDSNIRSKPLQIHPETIFGIKYWSGYADTYASIEIVVLSGGISKSIYGETKAGPSTPTDSDYNIYKTLGLSSSVSASITDVYFTVSVPASPTLEERRGYISSFYSTISSFKDDVASNSEISQNYLNNWEAENKGKYDNPRTSDGDAGYFMHDSAYGINKMTWKSNKVTANTMLIVDPSVYLYTKFKTTATGLPSGYKVYMQLSFIAKTSSGNVPKTFDIPITTASWYIYAANIYTKFPPPSGTTQYALNGIKIIVNVPTYFNGNRYQYTYLDYVYISKDLDNDGNLDQAGGSKGDGAMGGDIDGDGMLNGYEWDHGAFNKLGSFPFCGSEGKGGWQDPYEYNARYAVLINGFDPDNNHNGFEGFPAFKNDFVGIYNILLAEGYLRTNIFGYFWNYGPGSLNGMVNWPADIYVLHSPKGDYQSDGDITRGIESLGRKITRNDFLFFFLIAHGYNMNSDDNAFTTWAYYPPSDNTYGVCWSTLAEKINKNLGGYTDQPRKYARGLFLCCACYAGSGAIKQMHGDQRIIITPSLVTEMSMTWKNPSLLGRGDAADHMEFLYNDKSNGFEYYLSNNPHSSILNAFQSGATAALDMDAPLPASFDFSIALIDGNGDGVGRTSDSLGDESFLPSVTYL